MKEIKAIVDAYRNMPEPRQGSALATVVRVEGSSYRREGARMLVMEDGHWIGGISGGCLEGDALRRAKNALVQDKSSLVTYDTTEDDAHQIGVGLGCNGIIDVLITPLGPNDQNHPIDLLEACLPQREPQVMLTVTGLEGTPEKLKLGDMFLVKSQDFWKSFPDQVLTATLQQDVREALEKGKSQTREYLLNQGSLSIFIEILPPPIHLVLFGGNYDVYPMARIAKELGWQVTVVANPTKLDRSIFKTADAVLDKRTAAPPVDAYTAFLLMAHDYKTDLTHLEKALTTEAPYIGLLGPRKRSVKMFDELAAAGKSISDDNWPRIYTPVGLDIGATTPEEIALAVLAEIKAIFSQRQAGFLRARVGTIH